MVDRQCSVQVSRIGLRVRAVIGLSLSAVAASAFALPVHVQVERGSATEYGAGFSVGRDSECFIITPAHVIEGATRDEITITDSKGRHAQADVVKSIQDFDAALLKIAGQVTIDCPTDWEEGDNTSGDIENSAFLVSKKVNSNGRTEQNRLFVTGISAEVIDLEPFDERNTLQEGDSGSSIYAGNRLVGMVVAVDTATGAVTAVSQSQIHGLFGADVLPQGQRTALVYPFIQNRSENVYATMAAYDYVGQRTPLAVVEGEPLDPQQLASGQVPVPTGVDFVVSGNIVELSSKRISNPNYKKPDGKKKHFGDLLMDSLKQSVTNSNEDARYLRVYNVDVEVTVIDVADNSRARNLERQSYEIPDDGTAVSEMDKTAVRSAVIQSLDNTFKKYGLPLAGS